MSVELSIEPSQSEYHPDKEVNRLEVYESLLFDNQSALWREVLHRKQRRSKAVTSNTTPNTKKTEAVMFDIDSEEEEGEQEAPKGSGRDVGTIIHLLLVYVGISHA